MNLPNQLTVARCVMTAIFVAFLSFDHVITYLIGYVVFVAAAITDYYDGKIARERNLVTNFGKLLDPVADKVLVVAAFVMLLGIPAMQVPPWSIVLILAREFLVTGARSLGAAQGSVIAANKWGKMKTILQMVYVCTFLFLATVLQGLADYPALVQAVPGDLGHYTAIIGQASKWSIILVALYTVYSGIQFARVNWKLLGLDQTA
ncbi:MAG: CDP-diacylglycerol--glycerol-3-phosphate 3-phosphatidyltransferase [Candidatus Hydrogenedentes bacterium]|nr:CDP-diacylglycerol--glycerol-3-phosphate 3-phosphatidyltransferase [Candidatus Hydrogenedentota bacterium]